MRLGVAIPSHALGNIATQALLDLQRSVLVEGPVPFLETTSSALTFNHNQCWCWGLNLFAAKEITHLLMMHSDVRPMMPHWIDLLIEEMQAADADVLGSFIAIKNPLGLTSTAIDTDYWAPQRLSLRQARQLPLTWASPNLLLNTGLLLFDLAKFVERKVRICFTINDDVYQDAKGVWRARFEPEDWNFSRQCHAQKVRQFVTRAVAIHHNGIALYGNAPAWGIEVDPGNVKGDPFVVTDAAGETMGFDPTEQAGPPPKKHVSANGLAAI